jgi:hypothetical protein
MKRLLRVIWTTTMDLTFTIAGMVVVQLTLSGDTQRIAGFANAAALLATYAWQIIKEFRHEKDEA